MTVVAVDGFDLYNGTGANTGVQAKWTILSGSIGAWSTSSGRFSGRCITALGGSSNKLLYRNLPSNYTDMAFGFAVRMDSIPASTTLFAGVGDGTTPQFGIAVTSTGAIQVSRYSSFTTPTAAAVLGTSAGGVITLNTWYYIEVEATINASTGVVKVYVNGTQVLNLTSVNNRNSSNSTASTIVLGCSDSGTMPTTDFDDLYFTDAATKLGERRVETLYPTSDVAQGFARSTGSTNYTLVDEAQVNGDTDYVQGSSVGDTDTYGFGDLSGTPATISAVQINAFAQKTDAGTRSIALQAKSGGTTSDGSDYGLGSGYAKLERLLTTDPNTSAAWTASGVNALQGGPKVTV